MSYKSNKVRTGPNALTVAGFTIPILVGSISTAVFADRVEDELADVSAISVAAQTYQENFRALENRLLRQGLNLTREEIESLLESDPATLETANERSADQQALLATAPAKFEVVGDTVITPPGGGGMVIPIRAGGSFNNGTDLEAFLNYTVKSTHIAFFGRAADGDVIGELAVDQGFGGKGYGVYGATGLVNGYGVYARNWAPIGDSSTTGGGVALVATGSIDGNYTTSGFNALDNHVAIMENLSTLSTHVLALSMPNDATLGVADNFVTFYHGGTTSADAVGAIEGTSGGVNYKSGSADFAEWLPRLNPDEAMGAGDIVGIRGGKVTRDLSQVEHVQVISTAPAFTGNDPGYAKQDQYALVSMMGQVPVKVVGAVNAGDYIVASGKNDGTGIAIAADRMTPEDFRLIVGRAWESDPEPGIKLINTAVGLGASDAYAYMHKQDQRIASLEQQLSRTIDRQERHIASLERRLSTKTAKLDSLAAQMSMLIEKLAYIQSTRILAKTSR